MAILKSTSPLDKKKDEINNPKTLQSKITDFFISLLIQLAILLALIVAGSIILYKCKVAQTNILPTCMEFTPYTDILPPIKPIIADINIVSSGDAKFSTKLSFPVDENIKSINEGVLGYLKTMIDGPKATVYTLYIAKTLQEVIANNLAISNTFYNFLYSTVSETLIIFLGPIFSSALYFLTIPINIIYMIILWFKNTYLLFSEQSISNGKTTWKDGEMWNAGKLLMTGLTIYMSFMVFLFLGSWCLIPITAFFISVFCEFFPYFIKATNNANGKPYNVHNTILNTLKNKCNLIMNIISFLVLINSSSEFGGYVAFVVFIACLILYFFSDVYKQLIPKGSSNGLGDFVQAVKKCVPPIVSTTPSVEKPDLSILGKIKSFLHL